MAIIVVSGAIANKMSNGGATWTRLSWLLGLKRLGYQVYFVEQIGRESCRDAQGAVAPFEHCRNLAYFAQVAAEFGFADVAALIYEDGAQVHGLRYSELLEIAEAADLFINISGHLTLEPLLRRFRHKAYLDLDPGFTQFWHASGNAGARLAGHDLYFTIGENIGAAGCAVPAGDIRWRHTRQPVLLEEWPVCAAPEPGRFTTVASWRGPYGPVEHGGTSFGLKVHQFRRLIELPRWARQEFEIALDIHPAEERDLALLREHGWRVVDPRAVAADPGAFRRYVQAAGAEFSVAQGIYVETHSGWFSDRTVRYLASGKPALVQDTGFSHNYPVGEGLLAFHTVEDALDGAQRIARDYAAHCQAARAMAETYFDSSKVLGEFLDEAGTAA